MPRQKFFRFLDFLAHSNLFIALGAALFSGSTRWWFGEEASPALLFFTGSATLFTYNFQKLIGDLDYSDRRNAPGRFYMYLGLGGMGITVWQLQWMQVGLMAIAGLLSLAFALPFWKNSQGSRDSLRKLPYLKVWIIVVVWLLAGVAVPFVVRDAAPYSAGAVTVFTLMQGALVFSLALAFDIRDMSVDSARQRTLPQILGLEGAKKLSLQSLFLSAFLAALLFLYGEVTATAMFLHVSICLAWFYFVSRCRPGMPHWYFPIVIDGALAVQGVGLWMLHSGG